MLVLTVDITFPMSLDVNLVLKKNLRSELLISILEQMTLQNSILKF